MPPRPRIQVPTQLQAPGFRPAASPVDTFAQTSEGSGLQQLASALSQVAPELGRFAVQMDREQDAESIREAEEAAGEDLLATKEEFEKARKERMIRNHQDPIFRARYQELVGRHAGEEAAQQFRQWRAQEIPDATTLEEYDEGVDAFLDTFVEEAVGDAIQNPAYRTAFQQTLQERILQDRDRFSAQAESKLATLADEEYISEQSASLRNDALNGADPEDIARMAGARLNAHLDLKAGGEDHPKAMARRYNEQTFQTMASQALSLAQDGQIDAAERVIAAMGSVKVGTGLLRDTSYGQEIYRQAVSSLEKADNVATQRETRQNNDFIQNTLTDTRTRIREEGLRLEDIQPTLNTLDSLGTPQAQIASDQLAQFARSWENAIGVTDPDLLATLTPRVYDPVGIDDTLAMLDRHLGARDLAQNDYIQLRNIATQVARERSAGGSLTSEAYKQARRLFEQQFENGVLGNMTNEDAERLRAALPQFTARWLSWSAQNPEAGFAEQAAELERMGDALLNEYPPSMSIDFGLTPPPPARWGLTRVITDEHWGAVDNAVQNGGVPTDAVESARLREAMQLSGISMAPPATEEDRQARLIQLQQLRNRQMPFMSDSIRREPVPSPGPEAPETISEPGSDQEGAQEPAGDASEPEGTPDQGEEAPEAQAAREQLEALPRDELERTLESARREFTELNDSLGATQGVRFNPTGLLASRGEPLFTVDTTGLERRNQLRTIIPIIEDILREDE